MRDTVPVKDFLLLLCANAVVLVQEIKKRALWLLERGVCAGFEITKVGKDAFFEFLGILDRSAKSLEAESQTSDNISAGNVKEIIPGRSQQGIVVTRRATNQDTQETYSPVGRRNRLIY